MTRATNMAAPGGVRIPPTGRRRSATGAAQEKRRAWGREWAQVAKAAAKQLREGE